jgi:hypothetical protein
VRTFESLFLRQPNELFINKIAKVLCALRVFSCVNACGFTLLQIPASMLLFMYT